MWPDDSGSWDFLGDAADVVSTPSLPSGWSLSEGVKAAATTAASLFNSAITAVSAYDSFQFARQQREVELLERSSAIDLNKTLTTAKLDIAKAQAAAAVNRARGTSMPDLSTVMGNINARIAGMSSGNSLMLWLTVAGVGIAAMQFFKARR